MSSRSVRWAVKKGGDFYAVEGLRSFSGKFVLLVTKLSGKGDDWTDVFVDPTARGVVGQLESKGYFPADEKEAHILSLSLLESINTSEENRGSAPQ